LASSRNTGKHHEDNEIFGTVEGTTMINITTVARTAAAAAALGALALAGAAPAQAVPIHASGFSAVESCTGLTGKITYGHGLTKKAKIHHSVFTGTLSGCSGFNGAQAGTGTVTANLVGKSSVTSVVESGTAVVSWPASSGLNPSIVAVTLRETGKNGPINVFGHVTSGAFTNASVSTALLPFAHKGSGSKAHPLKRQSVVNTAPLAVSVNLG
jgi:hypothetical protein